MPSLSINRHPSKGYLLEAECIVPLPPHEIFPFFADAHNLQRLTPDWLHFEVLSPPDEPIYAGRRIDYRLRIHGVPMNWQSEITTWQPFRRFVDEQRRGPYRWWRHEHLFEACEGGTRVVDRVHYGVPGGRLIHWLLVGRDVQRIFQYRQLALTRLFGEASRHVELDVTPR